MKKIFLTIIFLLLFGMVFTSQYFFDEIKAKAPITEPIVLNSSVMKVIDLGMNNVASDMAWLSSIQYFGGKHTNIAPKLADYLFLATELDPKFSYPYAFGVLILPSVHETDKGIELAKKGIAEAVPDWRIPYYLATTYHINLKDYKNAAYYFDIAANTAGAPEGIKKIAARYGSTATSRDQTILIWQGIYESSNDEVVKERAKNYILHYQLMTFLESEALQYKAKFGRFPTTPEEMVPNIIKEIPTDPLGFQFEFNDKGNVVLK